MIRWPTSDGTRERDLVDIHVSRDGRTGSAISGQQVDDAFRKSSFDDEFADPKRGQRRLLGWFH
jgi:hypothetical protein